MVLYREDPSSTDIEPNVRSRFPPLTGQLLGDKDMTLTQDRSHRLASERRLKMARSAHAYVRGSMGKFYDWLEQSDSRLPNGPPVWICGDCHLGNLGPLASRKGRVEIQIRDLDQTVIGNPAHDLVRLALSLASSARGSDLPGVTTAHMLEHLSSGYVEGLTRISGGEPFKRPPEIRKVLNRAMRRGWQDLMIERLRTDRPHLGVSKRFWPLEAGERDGIDALFQSDTREELIDRLRISDSDSLRVAGAAYWMKGCSSLGRLRYAVLIRCGEGDQARHRLIDVKEATQAAAPRSPQAAMPRDNAERVVQGARAISPHLGERMVAARLMERTVVLRELAPQDLKLELGALRPDRAVALAAYLGAVLGRAHGRQLKASDASVWAREIASTSGALDAPGWLWSSVVDLLSVHEAAYLEHCRRFALDRKEAA